MAKKSDAGGGVLLVIGAIVAGLVAAYEWAMKNLLIVGLVVVLLVLGAVLSRYLASKTRDARFRALSD